MLNLWYHLSAWLTIQSWTVCRRGLLCIVYSCVNLTIKIVNKITRYFNTNYICNAFDLEANTSNPANCHSPSSCPFSVRKDIKPIVLQALGFFFCYAWQGVSGNKLAYFAGRQAKRKGGVSVKNQMQDESGKTRIFCRYIIRNGRRIYPKHSKYFSFLVDSKKVA